MDTPKYEKNYISYRSETSPLVLVEQQNALMLFTNTRPTVRG